MQIDENLAEEIFVELLSTIDSRAKEYVENCSTFRNFTDGEKHLLDVTCELSDEIEECRTRFYTCMNTAREYFGGNNY